MANGWTPERRAKHAEAIRSWAPWAKSTGPKTKEGKAKSRLNPSKGGVRPKIRECSRLLRKINAKIAEVSGEKQD